MSAWRAWRKRTWGLEERVSKLMKAGAMDEPVWWRAYKKHPPYVMKQDGSEVVNKYTFPEQALLRKYYRKNPTVKGRIVVDLFDEEQRIPAIDFVRRWMAVMKEKKMSEKDAYAVVEQEFAGKDKDPKSRTDQKKEKRLMSLKQQYNEWINAEEEFWDKTGEARKAKQESTDPNLK